MLSEKSKELRLNHMRVKDLRKLARLSPIPGRYNAPSPIFGSKAEADPLTVPLIE